VPVLVPVQVVAPELLIAHASVPLMRVREPSS
jgi:hypothetical protein